MQLIAITSYHMVGCERGIGRSSWQTNSATTEICNIGLVIISVHNSANVSGVMGEAGQNEVRIIAWWDVVPGEVNMH
jgi:hypothetical protein